MNVASYIRVSTAEQATHGHSLDSQREVLRTYAEREELCIQQSFEEVHSAYSSGRPVFEKMYQYLEGHPEVEAVLVYKGDRMARNLHDFSRITEVLGRRIISATENLPNNSTGKMMGGINAVFSRHFSDQLSERVQQGLQTKAEKGLYPGPAPDGYLNVSGRIVPDEERASVIRELFDVFQHPKMTLASLVKYANRRGLRTRKGKHISSSSLRYFLRNPVYRGQFKWKGRTCEGTHEPLVSTVVFGKTQAKLDRKTHVHTVREFPYRGFLSCNLCGCAITAQIKKEKYIYYHCTGGRGKCDGQKVIGQADLSNRLRPVVESVHFTEAQVEYLLKALRKSKGSTQSSVQLKLEELRGTLARLEEDKTGAFTNKLRGKITDEFWAKYDDDLDGRIFLIKSRIQELEGRQKGVLFDPRAALELLNRATSLYDRQSDTQKARLLKALVSNCKLDRGNVVPVYKEPFGTVAIAVQTADLSGGLLSNCVLSKFEPLSSTEIRNTGCSKHVRTSLHHSKIGGIPEAPYRRCFAIRAPQTFQLRYSVNLGLQQPQLMHVDVLRKRGSTSIFILSLVRLSRRRLLCLAAASLRIA